MQDYYSMYTWIMDKQSELERQASERRLARRGRHSHWVLQWPIARRRHEPVEHAHHRHHSGLAA